MSSSVPRDPADRWRVAIASSRDALADALARSLAVEFEILSFRGDASDIPSTCSRFEADVVVIDVGCRAFAVIDAVKALKCGNPLVRVVLVASDLPDDVVLDALRLDVEGLVVNPSRASIVAECVRQVRDGRLCLDQEIVRRAAKTLILRTAAMRELEGVLTPREIEIARLVGGGMTNKEVAARLFISEGTIKVHLHKIFAKLQTRTRKALAEYMRDKGLV